MKNFFRWAKDSYRLWTLAPPRSSEWPELEKKHLKEQPICQWCHGAINLQVHHIEPFHLHPELELDPNNLITLCETKPLNCHLIHGHLGSWKKFNIDIVKQCIEKYDKKTN